MPFSGAVPMALFLAKATLLLLAALAGSTLLRRASAGARHLVWLAALVGVLALPLLSRISSLRIGVLPSGLSLGSATRDPAPPDMARELISPVAPATPAPDRAMTPPPVPAATPMPSPAPVAASTPAPAERAPRFAAAGLSILSAIALVWGAVALALVGWLAAGALYVRRLAASGRELTAAGWTTPLCEAADRLDLDVPPRLVASDRIEMAFACRALAPTIVLPADSESWTDDRRRAVLMHELAHIKRHDLLGHALSRLACALYWFHPLVWTAAKHLRAESERACDDLVLSCGARPSEYAQHLLDMVTNVRDHGAPVMALPMARKKEFEGRMLAILDPAIRRASPGRLQSAAVVTTLGVLSLTVAAAAPAAVRTSVTDRSQAVQTPPAETIATRRALSATAADTSIASPVTTPSETRRQTRHDARIETRADTRTNALTETSASSATNENAVGLSGVPSVLGAIINEAAKQAAGAVGSSLEQVARDFVRQGKAQGQDTSRVALMVRVLASDSDATVRRTAAWALSDIDTPAARTALTTAMRRDADDRVREMAAWGLGEQENESSASALAEALRSDKSARVRETCAWALGQLEAKGEISALEGALGDADRQVRRTAVWAIGQSGTRTAPRGLTNALADSSRGVRLVAAWSLGEIEDTATAPAIIAAYKRERDAEVRSAELRALAIMGQASTDVLEEALKSSDPQIRRRAVALLAGQSGVDVWPWPMPRPRPSP